MLVIGGEGPVVVLDTNPGAEQVLQKLGTSSPVLGVSLSHDGMTMAITSGSSANVVDVMTGLTLFVEPCEDRVRAVSISGQGSLLASGASDARFRVSSTQHHHPNMSHYYDVCQAMNCRSTLAAITTRCPLAGSGRNPHTGESILQFAVRSHNTGLDTSQRAHNKI